MDKPIYFKVWSGSTIIYRVRKVDTVGGELVYYYRLKMSNSCVSIAARLVTTMTYTDAVAHKLTMLNCVVVD